MPKVVYITDKAVVIICEHIPRQGGDPRKNVEIASELDEKFCQHCGLRVDADLKNQELVNRTQGQENFQISCFAKDKEDFVLKGIEKLKKGEGMV